MKRLYTRLPQLWRALENDKPNELLAIVELMRTKTGNRIELNKAFVALGAWIFGVWYDLYGEEFYERTKESDDAR